MKIEKISKRGKYHQNIDSENQDILQIYNFEEVTLAIICDGAGEFSHGKDAAKRVADTIAELCQEWGRTMFEKKASYIKKVVQKKIKEDLLLCAEHMQINPEQLATTIVALIINNRGDFIAIHLGDGGIIGKVYEKKEASVISSPENGIFKNYTYLTMNCNMHEHLRVYKNEKKYKELLLFSDGAEEVDSWFEVMSGEEDFKQFITKVENVQTKDDLSLIMIDTIP